MRIRRVIRMCIRFFWAGDLAMAVVAMAGVAVAGVAVRWDVLREPMLYGGLVFGRDGGEETILFGGASPLTEWDCKSGSGGLEKQKIFLFLFVFVNRLKIG